MPTEIIHLRYNCSMNYLFTEINLRLTLPYSVRPLCSATIPESIESTGEASPLKHPSNANMNTDTNFSIYHNTIPPPPWCNNPYWAIASSLSRLHEHTTLDRIPLDEWSARRIDCYLKTHGNQKRRKSVPTTGFESAIPASEQSQT
jgi:hypothetical protein